MRGWAQGPPAKRLPLVWLQARSQQSGAREGSLCSGPPAPLSQDGCGVEESGLGAGRSWVSPWWLPARLLCVRLEGCVWGGGSYPQGLLRGSGGAGPGRALPGWPGWGASQGAGQPRGSPGSTGWRRGWRRGRLLSGSPASASARSSPAALRPLLRVPDSEWERPCALEQRGPGPALPPSALPGSCQPVLTAWGAGSGPQPFEWISGDRRESWWSTRMPALSLCPCLTDLGGCKEAQGRTFQRVCAVSLGLCGPQGLWFPGGCGPWLREPGCGEALSVSPAPPLTCFGQLPLLLWALGPSGTGSGAGGSFSSEGAGPESPPALLGAVGESGRGRPPGAWPSASSAAPGSWLGSP